MTTATSIHVGLTEEEQKILEALPDKRLRSAIIRRLILAYGAFSSANTSALSVALKGDIKITSKKRSNNGPK